MQESLIASVRRGESEILRIDALRKRYPGRYDGLRLNRGPLGKFLVEGQVRTRDDLATLKSELSYLLGEERMNDISAVEVSSERAATAPTAKP
jgi:hypothetical protein